MKAASSDGVLCAVLQGVASSSERQRAGLRRGGRGGQREGEGEGCKDGHG